MQQQCPNLYKRARLSTGLTQEAAAEKLDLSVESLKQYEGGRRIPPDDVVARMVEVYRLPWLALEHSQATDTLGVLPEVEPRPLPMASIALRNRLHDATGRLDALLRIAEDGIIDNTERPEFDDIVEELRETMAAIYQVIYSGAKKERPEAGTSERSGEKVCGLEQSTLERVNYSTRSTPHASPNFCREGGASL
jgi:transcriptional regulator with XRE-family HTH domain